MYHANPYQQYRQNSVTSAGKGKLTLILYENAVKFIKQAIKFIEEGKLQEAHNAIMKSQEIITHLSDTLNMDYDLSNNLHSLYEYINRRLIEANMKKNQLILGEALDLVSDLRDTWQEAMKIAAPPEAIGL
ncbi:MAG: flagellar export chaperone FliS [Desulfotomaculaceae bacterium]|nr:flagellar export chaperone FliS [Desulfotomaculaceae bacterium]